MRPTTGGSRGSRSSRLLRNVTGKNQQLAKLNTKKKRLKSGRMSSA